MGHQLLSAGNPLWKGMRNGRRLEKAGGYQKEKHTHTHTYTRTQDGRGGGA